MLLLACFVAMPAAASLERPRLLTSADDFALMTGPAALPAAFADAIARARAEVDPYLVELPDIPYPKDPGGGYTHEQHKRNSVTILNAGFLYQLSGDRAYARLVRDMLQAYARMYPGLKEHPEQKNQAPGKLFWQSLNEAVWLVTSIQGYDAVYTALEDGERAFIENELFHPMVSFLSDEAPQTFDRIHNHGTWAVAAVGMTGYVLDEPEYVEKALYGLKKDGSAGFIRQLEELFSPDGYYSEGPYYQRYALMPFVLFAKVIERNEPQRKIFAYRDGVLLKAVYSVIQLSYGGYFFPINDAMKDKGLDTRELCYGVAVIYALKGDPRLLPIARLQGRVVLTGDGLRLAKALDAGQEKPFEFRSMQLRDGPDGTHGALGVLRSSDTPGHQALVFKATAQGMGHGHFDRLTWLFYDNGHEIVSDYGAARFLNVEEKQGGRYLPENKSWAKQTVAHNTLVVDQASQFGGDWKHGEQFYPTPLVFDTGEKVEIVAGRMENAYDGVVFSRALAMLKTSGFPNPVILDVLQVESEAQHQYDLPLHFKGHITHVSHPLKASTTAMSALGDKNGYQHLWLRASAAVDKGELFQLTWLNNGRFYTYSVLAKNAMDVLFTETGAGDAEFNLRTEQAVILRVQNASDHTFVGVLEPHGEYDGSREFTTASASNVAHIAHFDDGDDVIRISPRTGAAVTLGLSFNPAGEKSHTVKTDGVDFQWSGSHRLFEE